MRLRAKSDPNYTGRGRSSSLIQTLSELMQWTPACVTFSRAVTTILDKVQLTFLFIYLYIGVGLINDFQYLPNLRLHVIFQNIKFEYQNYIIHIIYILSLNLSGIIYSSGISSPWPLVEHDGII